jgi:uncharacterized membrane protein YkgB
VKTIQRTILYTKYKDLILLNKNIIVAGICAFVSAAVVTQFYYTQYNESHIATSIVALISEYSVYIPIFGLLFYRDNRYRYTNPLTGEKDFKTLKRDIKKLLTAFSVSEVAYSLSKITVTYQILQIGLMPYQASMFGSIAASAVSIVLINFMITRVVKLFRT